MWRRRLALCLAFVVAAVIMPYAWSRLASRWNAVSIKVAPNPSATPPDSRTLRIGTYNIAHGRGPEVGTSNWEGRNRTGMRQRLKDIGSLLNAQDLDVVVLNEVDFSAVWSRHTDQAEIIAAAGGYPFIARQRNVDVTFPGVRVVFGNAILSRHPITEVHFEPFEPLSRREALLAGNHDSLRITIRLPDGTLTHIWGVHLEVRDAGSRRRAARAIVERLKTVEGPVVVLGDFNTGPASFSTKAVTETAVDILLASEQVACFPPANLPEAQFTWPAKKPRASIDWIFHTDHWRLESGTVLSSVLSDHLPVIATLSLKTDGASPASLTTRAGPED